MSFRLDFTKKAQSDMAFHEKSGNKNHFVRSGDPIRRAY